MRSTLTSDAIRPLLTAAARILFVVVGLPILHVAELVVRVRIGAVISYHIGHLAVEPDLDLRRRQSKQTDPKVLRVLLVGNIANETLVKLYSREVKIIRSRWLHAGYYAVAPILRRTRFYDPPVLDASLYPPLVDRDMFRVYADSTSQIRFTREEEKFGRQQLERMGIGTEDWFVCIHARDSGYLQRLDHPELDISSRAFRNTTIAPFTALADAISELGGYAVRMGADVDGPMVSDLPRVIDYASIWRSDFLDIYLSARCRFFIGTTSGLICVPAVFDVPNAMSNAVPPTSIAWGRKSLFTPKLYRWKRDGELLTFDECFALGLFDMQMSREITTQTFDRLEIDVIENDARDLVGLGRDMYDLVSGEPASPRAVELQQMYKAKYLSEVPFSEVGSQLAPSFALRYEYLIRTS